MKEIFYMMNMMVKMVNKKKKKNKLILEHLKKAKRMEILLQLKGKMILPNANLKMMN